MANFPSVTAGGAFESPAVQDAIKALASQAVDDRLAALEYTTGLRAFPLPEGIQGGYARVIRTGPVATVIVRNLYGLPDRVDFGVLPLGMRPLASTNVPMEAGGGQLVVSANGEVYVEGQSSSGSWIDVQVTYQVSRPDVRPNPPFSPA